MRDNLHTRIATVLDHHYPVTTHADGTPDHLCCCGLPRQHVADAVIRELDLGIPCTNNGCRIRQLTRKHAQKHGNTTPGTE